MAKRILLKCPQGHRREVGVERAGTRVKCQECEHVWAIPEAPAAPPEVAPPVTTSAPRYGLDPLAIGIIVVGAVCVLWAGGSAVLPARDARPTSSAREDWAGFEAALPKMPGEMRYALERSPARVTWTIDAGMWTSLGVEERKDLAFGAAKVTRAAGERYLGAPPAVAFVNSRGREVATVSYWSGAVELK